jgi:transcriptional regulator with XRE-family HTH domain
MKLAQYLHDNHLTQSAFAKLVGAGQVQVSMWTNGKAWPTQSMAIEIFNATNGAVTPNDFLPDDVTQMGEVR